MADVIAICVEDGKPHFICLNYWQMLRGEVKSVLKKIQAPKHNITGQERKAIDELRKDKTRIILTADKGVSIVVMNRDDYNRKAEDILHQPAYKSIPNDPTNKYKTKLYGRFQPGVIRLKC